ncbi:MAG: hypothetical protein JW839_12400 [Candidatus Lokiarchaeota archaeon]|nr:hypothetical protein [Candidatus Lokiarchaeota archaeon]
MIYKEDINAAKQRMDAWWSHEIVDRPVLAYTCPKPNVAPKAWCDHWYLAKHHDDIEGYADQFEAASVATEFGGERFPVLNPNYGAGVFACVFGADSVFKSGTTWFFRQTSLDEIVPLLEGAAFNMSNPWYERLVKVTEYAAKRANDQYVVATTDYGGILDILASFLSPKDMFYAMRNKAGLVDTCRAIILEKSQKLFDALTSITLEHCHGTSSWMGLWDRTTWYPLQCDFSYMLSPKWFTRYVLPDLESQCQHLGHAIYHLDGVNQLPFLDELLAIPELTGIQWVPGDGKPPMADEAWLPVYKKIQAAGKNIVMDAAPQDLMRVYNNLDPKGLYVGTHFPGKIWAEYYLPPFLGGMGGVDDE